MRAFHNDRAVKAKYIERVNRHIAAGNLIRGIGWHRGKGCAVGCTLESYDHSRYPIELGIPEWLGRVEDRLYEGMSLEKSKTWPRDFLSAIHVGADLERVKAPFLILVLKSALESIDRQRFPKVALAVNNSIALWQRDDTGSPDWYGAAVAAARAARAAGDEAQVQAAVAALEARAASAGAAVEVMAVRVGKMARLAAKSAEAAAARAADTVEVPGMAAWPDAGWEVSAAAARADAEWAVSAAAARAANTAVMSGTAAWPEAGWAVSAAVAQAWEAMGNAEAICDYFADELLKLLEECKALEEGNG